MKAKLIWLAALMAIGISLSAQKTIKVYHDPYTKSRLKEQYTVNSFGLQHGNYKQWNDDGILLYDFNFNNGEQHGKCITYFSFGEYGVGFHCSGKPLKIEYFSNGEPIGTHTTNKCRNGNSTILESEKKYAGKKYELTYYFENGNKMSYEEGILRDNKEWANGKYIEYYENGSVHTEGNYKDIGGYNRPIKIGCWKYFYENGKFMGEENFNEAGQLNGKYCKYNDNGKKIQIGEYYHNPAEQGTGKTAVKSGLWITYDTNEHKIVEANFNTDGEYNGKYIEYYPNEIKKREGMYEKNKKNGLWVEFYTNGQKKCECNYIQDKNSGLYQLWADNGNILIKGEYTNGNKTGIWTEYDSINNILSKGEYQDNYKIGEWTVIHNNLKSKGIYKVFKKADFKNEKISLPQGVWNFYDANDSIEYVIKYENKYDNQGLYEHEVYIDDNKKRMYLAQKKLSPTELLNEQIEILRFKMNLNNQKFESYCKEEKSIALNQPPIIDYPFGKTFYTKCNELLKYYQTIFDDEKSLMKKEEIVKNHEKAVDKIIFLTKTDTQLLNKSLKKAKNADDIKNILGL